MATILLVDDEDMVVRVVTTALTRAGHTVHAAEFGEEADRIACKLARIDAIIVDHRMDPESGRTIDERLLRTYPDAKVMHISGYPREFLEQERSFLPGAAYLSKPFTSRQVQGSVAALLASNPAAGGWQRSKEGPVDMPSVTRSATRAVPPRGFVVIGLSGRVAGNSQSLGWRFSR